jgi:hypothetical protein
MRIGFLTETCLLPACRRTQSDASPPNSDGGEITKNSENIQEPQYDRNNHHGIQYGLDGPGHRDKSVNEPQNDTYHDQNHDHMN